MPHRNRFVRKVAIGCVLLFAACSGSGEGGGPGGAGGSTGGSAGTTGGTGGGAGSSSTAGTTGAAGSVAGTSGGSSAGAIGTGGAGTSGGAGRGGDGGANGGNAGAAAGAGGSANGGRGGSTGGRGGASGGRGGSGGTAGTTGAGGRGGTTGTAGTGGGTGGGGVTCPSPALAAGDTNKTIQVGSDSRTYILHVPSKYTGTAAVPLVVDFHPLGGSGSSESGSSPYKALTDAEGVISAYPNGKSGPSGGAWDVGPCCVANVDDVGFAKALVADVEKVACIDTRRVYAVGFSM